MNTIFARRTLGFTAALLLAVVASASAFAAGPAKWIEVEGLVNPEAAFMINVDVDKPERVYRDGEPMTVSFEAERECYVYLVYYSGDQATVLFPNEHQPDNLVPAQTRVLIPGDKAPFRFRTSAPFGKEVLHVVACTEKLDSFGPPRKGSFKSLDGVNLKQMVVEVKKQKQEDWAEARIDLTTCGHDDVAPKTGRRFGVCIGISQYDHERIQDLQVSHHDAQRMAEALQKECGADEVAVLINEQATRANIERLLFHDLVEKTHPGDTVFVFFSGHGGRCADQNGDEDDGFDEYLVPRDGILGKPETMILDDTFARWMQELSGRQIALFLDNCYSGGASKGIKSLGSDVDTGGKKLDGFDVEIRRAKDLGQKNTIVLAACQANQLAWEMPASQKGSVLTHYLIASLKDKAADGNEDGQLTVQESYGYVKEKVEGYVKEKFQTDQNPIIFDNAEDGIVFRQKR